MDDEIRNQVELRKWSIDKAIECGGGKDVVDLAQSIHAFVEHKTILAADKKTIEKTWSATTLTPVQKAVVQAMMKRHENDEKINGSELAKDLKMTQSNASTILRKLVKLKYVRREGNKFWPVLDPSGQQLPPHLVKCPPAAAGGYKPLTATIGDSAKIKRAA